MSAPGDSRASGETGNNRDGTGEAWAGKRHQLDLAGNGIAIWQTIAARRATYDTMMWQTPALGLAAQAFLFTLALATDTSPTGRLIAATLSLTLSVLVLQLMAKHRYLESKDSLLLESIERSLGFVEALGTVPHGRMDERYPSALTRSVPPRDRATRFASWVVGLKSFRVWMIGQSLFGLTAIAVIILVILGRSSWIGTGR